MSESAIMFNHAMTAAASSENVHCRAEQCPGPRRSGKKRPQSRQLLSCTKCRDRKVKVGESLFGSVKSLSRVRDDTGVLQADQTTVRSYESLFRMLCSGPSQGVPLRR
jgi:hypothetical protein